MIEQIVKPCTPCKPICRAASPALLQVAKSVACQTVKDVIHEHFRRKAREIREQLTESVQIGSHGSRDNNADNRDRWESLDDGAALSGDSMASSRSTPNGTASAEYKKNLERLRRLLDDLESGKLVTAT